jgi:hypothetical protein
MNVSGKVPVSINPHGRTTMKKTLSVLAALGLVLSMSGMAMAAGTASGEMTTRALLVNSCTVSAATMTFGDIAGLVSTGDQTTDTAGSLMVACTTGVVPYIWSNTGRVLTGPGGTIAFKLSQTSGAADNQLPIKAVTRESIRGYTSDGTMIAVPLYGSILATNFGGKPAGTYTANILVNIEYNVPPPPINN